MFVDGPADAISVRNTLFEKLNGNALMLSNDVSNSQILNNSFINIGESAMLAVGSSRLLDATAGLGRLPTKNLFEGNLVDTVGIFGKQTSGYFKAVARENIFRKNVMFNGPRAGVNFSDGAAGGEILEGNLFFNFVRESGDHGMFNSWDRQPYLYSTVDNDPTSPVAITPMPHQLRNNFCLNKNFATNHQTRSGYCFDFDDGSSQYNSTGNVMYAGGFKVRDGVNRTQVGNLVVAGRVADLQVKGFDSNVVTNNINIDDSGEFYNCVGDAFAKGSLAANNQYISPPNAGFKPGCTEACGSLECWQKAGYDAGSTYSAEVTEEQILGWAKGLLSMA